MEDHKVGGRKRMHALIVNAASNKEIQTLTCVFLNIPLATRVMLLMTVRGAVILN